MLKIYNVFIFYKDIQTESEDTFILSRAARIHHTRLRIANTTSILIRADAIRKIVVVGAELIRAIIAHPRASSTCRYAKRHAVICDTHICAWHNRGTGYCENG